jgi:transposase
MEACSGAHHWARLFAQRGHTVKLMAPKFVTPYRMSGKHGKTDAATEDHDVLPLWIDSEAFAERTHHVERVAGLQRCETLMQRELHPLWSWFPYQEPPRVWCA